MNRVILWAAASAFIGLAPQVALAKKQPGKGPCKTGAECSSGTCIDVNGKSYCSASCGACPSGMYCDAQLFHPFGLSVCVLGSASAPVKLEKPPRIPCASDDECSGDLVCAQLMGRRDCTLPCAMNAQCDIPEMMGVKMNHLECAIDEGKKERKACLPRKACVANPASCMSIDPKAMGGAMQGMMGLAGDAAVGAGVGMNAPSDPMGARLPEADKMEAAAPGEKPQEALRPMTEPAFKAFLAQVKGEAFDSGRAALIDTAAANNAFTCRQVARVIEIISFSEERMTVLRTLAPRITDRENKHVILGKLTFDGEKTEASSILAQ